MDTRLYPPCLHIVCYSIALTRVSEMNGRRHDIGFWKETGMGTNQKRLELCPLPGRCVGNSHQSRRRCRLL